MTVLFANCCLLPPPYISCTISNLISVISIKKSHTYLNDNHRVPRNKGIEPEVSQTYQKLWWIVSMSTIFFNRPWWSRRRIYMQLLLLFHINQKVWIGFFFNIYRESAICTRSSNPRCGRTYLCGGMSGMTTLNFRWGWWWWARNCISQIPFLSANK